MAAKQVPGVLASFVHIDAACDAIGALRAGGRKDFTVYSAAPIHEIEEALGIHNSPVRLFTLIGGLTGCTAGFAMAIWMSRDWPLLVGGKPIAAVAPYVVIGFELTILLGALSTVAGIILLSLRNPTTGMAYDPSFTDDRIGIFVPTSADQVAGVRELFQHAGAVEVRHDA
jgi:molybdopterin-containing oxidoreductase family membrane subunit